MKAAVSTKKGNPHKAFDIRTVDRPTPTADEVLIKVDAFGLNYADVMARLGLYQDAPKFPAILGYEVVGHITQVGANVSHVKEGQRVVAMTRFGGYAEYAVANAMGVVEIPQDMSNGVACALATQYVTAYYSGIELANMQAGDHILIQAAAGGVGTALTQLAKWKGCVSYGTAGSEEKIEYIKQQGITHPINYRKQDFEKAVKAILGDRGLDIVVDSLGGDYIKKGMRSLGSGGRLVALGAAKLSNTNLFQKIGVLLGFGIYHPISFMTSSKAFIGVNMLRIADDRSETIQRCLKTVVDMTAQGILNPMVGGEFPLEDIAKAHEYLEQRKSIGKLIVNI